MVFMGPTELISPVSSACKHLLIGHSTLAVLNVFFKFEVVFIVKV